MRFHIFAIALTTLLFQRTSLAQPDPNTYMQCPPGAEVCLDCKALENSLQTPDSGMNTVVYNVTHDGQGGVKGLFFSSLASSTQLGVGAIVTATQAVRRPTLFRNFETIQLDLSTILGFLLDRAGTTLGMYWCDENPAACPGGGPADIGKVFYFEELRQKTDQNGETHFVDGQTHMCQITPRL